MKNRNKNYSFRNLNHNTKGSQQYILNVPKTNPQIFGSNSIKIESINNWNKMIYSRKLPSVLNSFINVPQKT